MSTKSKLVLGCIVIAIALLACGGTPVTTEVLSVAVTDRAETDISGFVNWTLSSSYRANGVQVGVRTEESASYNWWSTYDDFNGSTGGGSGVFYKDSILLVTFQNGSRVAFRIRVDESGNCQGLEYATQE